MSQRHPIRGGLGGLFVGLGLAMMAVIYGLVRVEGPLVPLGIVAACAVAGIALAMFWPAGEAETAFD